MNKLKWKNEKRKVADLIPAEYNARKISPKQRDDLRKSIEENGEVEPVVINLDNKLIGGHQRVSLYADMGLEEIDVRVPSRQLTLEEEMRLNIRLNKNTGEWDEDKLAEFDSDLLLDVGFNDKDIDRMFDDDEEDEPEIVLPTVAKAKLGELYLLGKHRLFCGDATKKEDVEKLMGGGQSKYGIYRSALQCRLWRCA